MRLIRLFLISLFLFVFLICVGCGENRSIKFEPSAVQVDGISFVWVASDGTVSYLEELNPQLWDSFLHDLAKLSEYSYWNDPVEVVTGSAVYISLKDGDSYLMNHYCTVFQNDEGARDTWQYYVEEDFCGLWNSYCEYEYRIP